MAETAVVCNELRCVLYCSRTAILSYVPVLTLGRVTGADQAQQEQLAATLGRRPGTGPERQRLTAAGSGPEGGQCRRSGTGGVRVPQSRPNPRGGSTLSSSARSSPQIASSWCACRFRANPTKHSGERYH